MVQTVFTATLNGVEALPVRVEVAVRRGTPMIGFVGLAPAAARECRERFRSAASQLGLRVPGLRITVNLAPADVRKDGAAFDLPVAVAVLAGAGHVPSDQARRWALVGELGLDGTVRKVRGVLPIALMLRATPAIDGLIVPEDNLAETRPASGLRVLGARNLAQVLAFLRGEADLVSADAASGLDPADTRSGTDYSEVAGQVAAKRAMEIAAAGGHNVLLRGVPGVGKTLLARALSSILPPLSRKEALEVTAVHSVAGRLPAGVGLLERSPLRSPHHTVTTAGLVGGGASARPGEISLAHHGVLFLDEVTEFRAPVLEALRQPLEEGAIWITRAGSHVRFPARFLLVAAMNPCACGRLGTSPHPCVCSPAMVRRHMATLSAPFLDRIDLHVDVEPLEWSEIHVDPGGRESPRMRRRVAAARRRAAARNGAAHTLNARIPHRTLADRCRLDASADALMSRASSRYGLSVRACHRLLRVARTIADLEACNRVRRGQLAEALQYRWRQPAADSGSRGTGGREMR